jgi:LPXTG-site transpeptidase (sortase) family protein
LEIASWGAGVAMLAFYFGARIGGEIEREQGIKAFVEARAEVNSPYPDFVTPRSLDWPDSESPVLVASQPALASQEWVGTQEDEMPVFPDMESLPIALLRIGRVGLEVPVYADTTERNLNRGAGWVKGTAAPDDGGNIAIAAHRDGYFRVLKDVAVGDVLELESITQERLYRVTEISIVEPGDTSSLSATETAAVTLVTCYPFYFVGHAPQRYIVRAVALQ